MKKIYSMYGTEVAEVSDELYEKIRNYVRAVPQNIGMVSRMPVAPCEELSVRFSHRYGDGCAMVYYNGSQIGSM